MFEIDDQNFLDELFVSEAKPALHRHSPVIIDAEAKIIDDILYITEKEK